MAATITAIDLASDAEVVKVQFGEAVGLGDAVYRDTTAGNQWKKAVNTSAGVAAGRDGVGISLTNTGTDTNAYGVVWTKGSGKIDTLSAVAGDSAGEVWIVGGVAGEIELIADSANTEVTTILGVGGPEGSSNTYDEFTLNPIYTGYVKA
jgi:hypothetical protein